MTKLSQAMLDQLTWYACEAERVGDYYGNSKQFWKRHEKIMQWLSEQTTKG